MKPKPPPGMKPLKALYGCHVCSEDASWPADNLFWSEQEWYCLMCWNDRKYHYSEDHGISLEDWIEKPPVAPQMEAEPQMINPVRGHMSGSRGCVGIVFFGVVLFAFAVLVYVEFFEGR